MGMKLILRPGAMQAQLVPAEVAAHHDLAGATVLDVADGFSLAGKVIDWQALAVVDDMATLRAAKWDAVKALRDHRRMGTIAVAGIGPVQADVESRALILGQVARAGIIGIGFAVTWTMADNTTRACTLADLNAIQRAIGDRDDACQARSRTLRAAINAAATPAALAAIDITAGWPA